MSAKYENCEKSHLAIAQSCLKQKKIWKHYNIQKVLTQLEAQSSNQQSSKKVASSHNSKLQDNIQISTFKTLKTKKFCQNFTVIIINFSTKINHYKFLKESMKDFCRQYLLWKIKIQNEILLKARFKYNLSEML